MQKDLIKPMDRVCKNRKEKIKYMLKHLLFKNRRVKRKSK